MKHKKITRAAALIALQSAPVVKYGGPQPKESGLDKFKREEKEREAAELEAKLAPSKAALAAGYKAASAASAMAFLSQQSAFDSDAKKCEEDPLRDWAA